MKRTLWEDGDRLDVDRAIMSFMAGEDVQLDRVLFPYDIRATAAHVRGLSRIGILTDDEARVICDHLDTLGAKFAGGEFLLDERFEDGHSAIEIYLTEAAGPLGEKVHTGRSRNDQVQVAVRLFIKDALAGLCRQQADIARACLEQAEAHPALPMPGYTHLQRAVPSSVGLWMAGFAEAYADNLVFTRGVAAVVDCNPLGTAAGYGVNLPLDRDGVSRELGFARLQINPQYVQNSRGKFEIMALQCASHALQDLRRLAWDLSLFTTREFGFVRLPPQYTTGSSIMPNKANPDVVELLRGRVAVVDAAVAEIQSVLSLSSGYHRDLQLTKAPLVRGLNAALQALAIVPALVRGLEFDEARMREAITADMFATDAAVERAAAGQSFRSAYRDVKAALGAGETTAPEASLAARTSPGATADLRLDRIRERIESAAAGLPPAGSG